MAPEARPGRRAWGSPPAGPAATTEHDDRLVIDCDRCAVRGTGCADCIVTVLLGGPPYGVPLDDEERRAIDVLSDAGLVPPLRMARPLDGPFLDPA